jgi:hypothetical protein
MTIPLKLPDTLTKLTVSSARLGVCQTVGLDTPLCLYSAYEEVLDRLRVAVRGLDGLRFLAGTSANLCQSSLNPCIDELLKLIGPLPPNKTVQAGAEDSQVGSVVDWRARYEYARDNLSWQWVIRNNPTPAQFDEAVADGIAAQLRIWDPTKDGK